MLDWKYDISYIIIVIIHQISALFCHCFWKKASSPAMIRHVMEIVKQNVGFLNPGQTPVIAFDQPLYALAKQIQWNWPNIYGKDKVVIMFGGIHIEMAALRTIGDWLEESGWTSALVEPDIASLGTADSFLKASHLTRTRHAYQVTASSLYIFMNRAYVKYSDFASQWNTSGIRCMAWAMH